MTPAEAMTLAASIVGLVLWTGVKVHILVAAMLWPVAIRRARMLGRRPPQGPYCEGQEVLAMVRGQWVPATVVESPWRCPTVKLRFDLPNATVTAWVLDVGVVPADCVGEDGSADA